MSLIIVVLPDEHISLPRPVTMKSYFRKLLRRKHPRMHGGPSDARADRSTSSQPPAMITTETTQPAGYETLPATSEVDVSKEMQVGSAHSNRPFSDSKSQVTTFPSGQVLAGTAASQGVPSPCSRFTCILNLIFRRDLPRETTQYPLARRGRCPRFVLTPYSQKDHETTPPQT